MHEQISTTTVGLFTFLLRSLLALAVFTTPGRWNPGTTRLSAQGGVVAAAERAAAALARRATVLTRQAAVAAERAAAASAAERAALTAAAERAEAAAVVERALAAAAAERAAAERAAAERAAALERAAADVRPGRVSDAAPGFARKLADWSEGSGLDESVLAGTICDALERALVDREPPTLRSVFTSIAGSLMFRGLDDPDARVIANEVLDIMIEEEGGPHDRVHSMVSRWKERNC
jgi:hypothetical protein